MLVMSIALNNMTLITNTHEVENEYEIKNLKQRLEVVQIDNVKLILMRYCVLKPEYDGMFASYLAKKIVMIITRPEEYLKEVENYANSIAKTID